MYILTILVPADIPKKLYGYNTSSTSIYVSWEDIANNAWRGTPGGFYLQFQSTKNATDKNIKKLK